jgi:pyruvate/2-oxoglutarate dehydrogenase complex dihydrolipoamide dehydrogenase (E3) component
MFRRFGSDVTIVQHHVRLLAGEDDDVSDEVATILREDGVAVLTETTPQRVAQGPDGRIQLTVRMAEGDRVLTGSHLLAAIGRVPNTDDLALDVAGIRVEADGHIQVDERLETTVPGVYAMGDAKSGPAFTHVSHDDSRVLRTNLLGPGGASTEGRLVPYTVFTDPELARVGSSENEARRQGRSIRVAKLPMGAISRAVETGEARGFMKAVVDADSGQILGCAILGAEAGELIAPVQVAMLAKLPYTALRDAILAHPTLAEGLNSLFMTLDSEIGG